MNKQDFNNVTAAYLENCVEVVSQLIKQITIDQKLCNYGFKHTISIICKQMLATKSFAEA